MRVKMHDLTGRVRNNRLQEETGVRISYLKQNESSYDKEV